MYTYFMHIKILCLHTNKVRTVKLIKNKNGYALIVPEAVAKLYAFKDGQIFNLEVKEGNNAVNFVFLTYATVVN